MGALNPPRVATGTVAKALTKYEHSKALRDMLFNWLTAATVIGLLLRREVVFLISETAGNVPLFLGPYTR